MREMLLLTLAVVATGCANYAAPFDTDPARPASPTRATYELRELPPPQEQVVAAVYRFRDQTGQYKATEAGASWSTAVTQGATSILVRALEESGWFVPIEREGLSNLLNERQIIQGIRSQYEGPDGERLGPLPPLLYAGILLEGGIIGYDTNLLTSGLGVRYFGAGGSGQSRQDQVTVYLRAVSTQTGRVLKTVTTTKTIASQQVEAGIFRFVDIDRLLESEIGYSFNEPPVVAVTEAIEEAVKNLIIEGVGDGLWALADPTQVDQPAFRTYESDRLAAEELDTWGMDRTANRSGFALALHGGARQYQGNYRDPLTRPLGDVALRWMPSSGWGFGLAASLGQIGADRVFESTAGSVAADAVWYFLAGSRTSPFLRSGIGFMKPDIRAEGVEMGVDVFPFVNVGGGIEHMPTRSVGLSLSLTNHYPLMDGLDGLTDGRGHDSVWNLSFGLTYYR